MKRLNPKNLIPIVSACFLLGAGTPTEPKSPPVEIGVASWNIEVFDGTGPTDRTFPTRTDRHLEMIAETILETGADVIGLQEIKGRRSLVQLADAINRLERQKKTGGFWMAGSARTRVDHIHLAFLWNSSTLELLGEVTELKELSCGYDGERVSSKEELRFHRVPLAARFRVKAAPENDFTVIVLHLKASKTGIFGGLDVNDIRRRGEWETLLRKWLLKPTAQGNLKDEDIVVLGDMNEAASNLAQLLDRHATGEDTRGRLILDPSDFSDEEAFLLFTSGDKEFPRDFTYQGNSEAGQGSSGEDKLYWSKNFIDHILITRSLLDNWDGEFDIEYFELTHDLKDHVHFSDHRPVSIKLNF